MLFSKIWNLECIQTNSRENYRKTQGNKIQRDKTTEEFSKNPYSTWYQEALVNAKTAQSDGFVQFLENKNIQSKPPIRLIAFYLPQFHPIPENDIWWGKGFTEWTNVSKAVPQFLGHYQPRIPGELGYYDLRVPDVQRNQVRLAKNYGIHGFCFYYYWFNGKRLLEKPLDQFVNDPSIDFPFCICWANENWTRRWDGLSNEILISQEHSFETDKVLIHDLVHLFKNPRYIRIDGRPLLIVYRADILQNTNEVLDYWRNYSEEIGVGKPFILAAQTFGYDDPSDDGFDGAVEFPPHNGEIIPEITDKVTLLNNHYNGHIFRYSDFANGSINRIKTRHFKRFNTIFPGWDNEPRRSGNGMTFDGSSPKIYGNWLEKACQHAFVNFPEEERIVFINAWNEWGEGAYLEPDRKFGYAYLQKTLDVLNGIQFNKSASQDDLESDFQKQLPNNSYTQRYKEITENWPQISKLDKELANLEFITKIADYIDSSLSDQREKTIAPIASVIIPVFNHLEDTVNCIKSILATSEKTPYEIIIADDCSTDKTQDLLSKCKNLVYIRNQTNLGFLNSCNNASHYASGSYFIFLNNDTIVLPGWLDSLIQTFKENPTAGLVGSKLVYPGGRLQEAGGIIWKDGGGTNFGRDDDPNKPEYNYLREADYCSGACICIPKSIWLELNGFDEVFSPAYYEDTDLAFRIREKGYKVLYQPFSQVIHIEGITSGTDISKGIKHYQSINKQRFFDRWKDVIQYFGDELSPRFLVRNHSRGNHILVIDVCTPKPDQDSGSIDTYNYLLTLRKLGYEVTFISVVDSQKVDRYVIDLQKRAGVYTIIFEFRLEEYIKTYGPLF